MKISEEIWQRPQLRQQAIAPPPLRQVPMSSPGVGFMSPTTSTSSGVMGSPLPKMNAGMAPSLNYPGGHPLPPHANHSMLPPHYGSAYARHMSHTDHMIFGGFPIASPVSAITPGSESLNSERAHPRFKMTRQSPSKTASQHVSQKITPSVTTTASATPRIRRLKFDAATSRKKRKRDNDEAVAFFFGIKVAAQPKTTTLNVFSFLCNKDLFAASLTCREWGRLAIDRELWRFGNESENDS